ERRHTSQYCYSPPHGLHPNQIFLPYRRENAEITEWCPPNWIKFPKFSTWPLEPFWFLQIRRRFVAAPQSRAEPRIVPGASERGVAAIDHEAVSGVIGRCLAHQIDRDAAEIAGLTEAAHRNPRHDVGDELVVGHDARGHLALDPAGKDRVR